MFDAAVHLDAPASALAASTRSASWSPDNDSVAFTLTATDHPTLGNITQVLGVDAETGDVDVFVERVFGEDIPDDPRIFLEVSFQARGAFLPPRDSGSDL